MALKNRLIKKLIHTPFILNFGQNFLGANQYKLELYQQALVGKHGALLDFGCSYGNTTPGFLNFEYHGIDIDEVAIGFAKRKYQAYPNVNFHCLDILKQEFKRNYFDHVLFASTGHHLSDEEFRKILEVLLIHLKPAGELHYFDIFQKPNDTWTTKLLTRFDQGKYIRTREQSAAFFKNYPVAEMRILPSPEKLVKLWDFMYVKITRP